MFSSSRGLCDLAQRWDEHSASLAIQLPFGMLLLRWASFWHFGGQQFCSKYYICTRRRHVPLHFSGRYGKKVKYFILCSFHFCKWASGLWAEKGFLVFRCLQGLRGNPGNPEFSHPRTPHYVRSFHSRWPNMALLGSLVSDLIDSKEVNSFY